MSGDGFLFASLTLAAVGTVLYLVGPTLDRWQARLERELARPRQGQPQR
jgi:hypothetical protein